MDFPNGFPKHLEPAVDAAMHDAEIKFLEYKRVVGNAFHGPLQRAAIRDWVSAVFFAFADQACLAGRDGIWTGEQLRKALNSFLEALALHAQIEKDPSGGSSHFDTQLAGITIKTIKDSATWIELQRKLKEVADSRLAEQHAIPRRSRESQEEDFIRPQVEARVREESLYRKATENAAPQMQDATLLQREPAELQKKASRVAREPNADLLKNQSGTLSRKKAAEALGMSVRNFDRLKATRKIKPIGAAGRKRYLIKDLLYFVNHRD